MASAAVPKLLYGTQWAMPSCAALSGFRTRVISAIWGRHSRMRCPEIVLAGLHEPTRVDPFFAAAYRTVMLARRIAHKSDARYAQFIRSVEAAGAPDKLRNLHGPAHGFLRACYALGIEVNVREDDFS